MIDLKSIENAAKKSEITIKDLTLERREIITVKLTTEDEHLIMTVLTLQGLANRVAPAVFFDHTNCVLPAPWFAGGSSKADVEFSDFYGRTRGFSFLPPITDAGKFFLKFSSATNGLLLYEESDENSVAAALNLSSRYLLTPVSERVYNAYKDAFSHFKLVGKIDLRAFSQKDVYTFLFETLLIKANLSGAYSLGYRFCGADGRSKTKYTYWGIDHAVQSGYFIFLLSCNERPRGSYDFMLQGSGEEYGIFCTLMARLARPAVMTGWNEPEWRWALCASRFGHFVYCTDYAFNLSFHAAVTPLGFVDAPRPAPAATLQNKVYLSIVANEGDTPKMASQLYNNGWLSPARGKIPANWAFNPTHTRLFPALSEYYRMTATQNDFFTIAPNGAGYNHIRGNAYLKDFLDATKADMSEQFSPVGDLWFCDRDGLKKYLEAMPDVEGVALEPHFGIPDGEAFLEDGRSCLRYGDRFYYWYNRGDLCTNCVVDRKKTLEYLVHLYGDGSRPVFVPIYGYEASLIDDFTDFALNLDPNIFEVVDMHTMHALNRLASKQYDRPSAISRGGKIGEGNLIRRADFRTFDGRAQFVSDERGLTVTIPPDAPKYEAGFRNDMLSSTALKGQYSAMVCLEGVVIPTDADVLVVGASTMTEGSDWMFWAYGDFDGYGLIDKWEPFWKPSRTGERSEEIPERVKKLYPNAVERLVLCVEGKPGDSITFDRLEFYKSKPQTTEKNI